ncbi:hypothetical protein JRQ81_012749 [Phrynocephalus forsythii]|uniref:Uncharacterized protein n=1 Tax=Phrynocephalus forsythii TaxID=171643 RepID=A0A9Q0Y2S9_9SAUR|nr:hypothetical protein JRQ81_012749 [Phrynocephalus forsythii]
MKSYKATSNSQGCKAKLRSVSEKARIWGTSFSPKTGEPSTGNGRAEQQHSQRLREVAVKATIAHHRDGRWLLKAPLGAAFLRVRLPGGEGGVCGLNGRIFIPTTP